MAKRQVTAFYEEDIEKILNELINNIHIELDALLLEDVADPKTITRLSIQRGTIERIRNVFGFEVKKLEEENDG